VAAACGLIAFAAAAARGAEPEFLIFDDGGYYFIRAGGRALFNVKASVTRERRPIQAGVYDDGYVLPSAAGPASPQTWNWGYDRASQVTGGEVWLNRLENDPMAGLFSDETADASVGPEIVGGMELWRFETGQQYTRLGIELGYAFHNISVDNRSRATATSMWRSAAHSLGGTVAPAPPYRGTFGGPGPLLDLQPSATATLFSPSAATFDGELESSLHMIKLGLWLQYPISPRASLNASMGYASIYADTQLKYRDSLTFADPRIPDQSARDRTLGGREWRPGGYAQARFEYRFTSQVGAYLGGEFAHHKDLTYSEEERRVTLDFGALFSVSAGLGVRF
jgi:hypothetical protein